MVIDMNEAKVRTLAQVRQVLAGTQAMELQAAVAGDEDRGSVCVDRIGAAPL
jgi:hypothetical protein